MVEKPNVLLFGAGSVGSVYIYQLQRAGCQVTAVCRSNYEVVKEKGFKLISLKYGNVQIRPDHVVKTTAECPPGTRYDFILVCSKSFPGSKPSLSDMIRPAVGGHDDTAIVLAQNGVDIEDEVAREFPNNPILSGVIYCPTTQIEPGVVEYPEMMNLLEVGTYPANAPASHQAKARQLAEFMIKAGGGAVVHDNIQIPRWQKIVHNAAWNSICALTLCTDGGFLSTSDPFACDLAKGVMLEVVALAKTIGIPNIDESTAEEKFSIGMKRMELNAGRAPSMLQDVRQGRPFEVEAIIGNVVRLGRQYHVSMPRLETVYALAKGRYDALLRQLEKDRN